MAKSIEELKTIATQVRRDILRMVCMAKSGHPGGSMSSTDILTYLYFNQMKHNPATWVDTDGLGERKTGFGAVQMAPTALYEPDLLVHDEVGNGLEEEVFLRDEVRIEDGEEFTLGNFHTFLEGAGLEILAVRAVDELDVVTTGGEFSDFLLGNFVAFVGRIVQNLNFVLVLGVVDSADCLMYL